MIHRRIIQLCNAAPHSSLSSCREYEIEPEGRQQLPRLIRGFCGILFDGGFHPPDPPGLKDCWSRAAGAGYVTALPERHSPQPSPGDRRVKLGEDRKPRAGEGLLAAMMLPWGRRR